MASVEVWDPAVGETVSPMRELVGRRHTQLGHVEANVVSDPEETILQRNPPSRGATMSTVTCSKCGHKEQTSMYAEPWLDSRRSRKIDSSKAVCYRCQVDLNAPEDWYDYRCTGCNGWFNVSRNTFDDWNLPGRRSRRRCNGPVCLPCAEGPSLASK